MTPRLIAHVDMDAFYASVEQLDFPQLRSKPVIVGGSSRRAVVCAASYEARRFGVHSAMPMYEARRRCPGGCYQPVRMWRYREVSARVFAILATYSEQIEGLSLDEAYLDLSGRQGSDEPEALGRGIKQAVRGRTSLTASVGLGPNKLVAKIASQQCKPDGLLYVPAARVQDTLDPLPVDVLWGIGPRTGAQLAKAGIRTVADLRRAPAPLTRALFGNQARYFQNLARGEDARTVGEEGERSVSQETTFEEDLGDFESLAAELRVLTEGLCELLQRDALHPRTLVLKLRTTDFKRHTHQRHFAPADQRFTVIWPLAGDLLHEWLAANPHRSLRLIGIGARDFDDVGQLTLFEPGVQHPHTVPQSAG
ncbi:MAG: DNA polymerase IV [Gammaproteobacteria bacterium]